MISKQWTSLSVVAAVLVAAASAIGVFTPAYARESPMWAAQGAGQDVVNLLVLVPLLLGATYYVAKGSARALLVWVGALVYTAYSSVLYSFFVHFGPWFPLYVATLGTSSFALIGVFVDLKIRDTATVTSQRRRMTSVAAFLVAVGVAFAALELTDIAVAIAAGKAPQGVDELGLLVNPIHVLDLAFILPAAILSGVLIWKRHPLGVLLAVPLLVFFSLMGLAMVGMILMMLYRGASASTAIPGLIFGPVVLVSIYLSCRTLRADEPGVASRIV